MASTTFSGPVTSTNGFITGSGSLVAVTGNITANSAANAGRTNLLNVAAGATVTLPAAAGTGNSYRFAVQTTVTSNSYIVKVANSTDVMAGRALVITDNAADAVIGFETTASSDTITLNGTTTGGIKGDTIELVDIASGLWLVTVNTSATGTEVTPFSATV
jgi:hypothetical protein